MLPANFHTGKSRIRPHPFAARSAAHNNAAQFALDTGRKNTERRKRRPCIQPVIVTTAHQLQSSALRCFGIPRQNPFIIGTESCYTRSRPRHDDWVSQELLRLQNRCDNLCHWQRLRYTTHRIRRIHCETAHTRKVRSFPHPSSPDRRPAVSALHIPDARQTCIADLCVTATDIEKGRAQTCLPTCRLNTAYSATDDRWTSSILAARKTWKSGTRQ